MTKQQDRRQSAGEPQSAPSNTGSPESVASSGIGRSTGSGGSQLTDQTIDKKSLAASIHTPLSVLKVVPMSALFHNNKVGSSFRDQQQAILDYSQQVQQQVATGANALLLPVTNRKVRDSGSLLFMLAFLGFLVYIISDSLVVKETDINLIVHGHDSYGNICGRNNRPVRFVDKSGQNYTDKPYTKYTLINSQFERYTLDSDGLKHGKLIYVKEHTGSGDQPELADQEWALSIQAARVKQTTLAPLNKRETPLKERLVTYQTVISTSQQASPPAAPNRLRRSPLVKPVTSQAPLLLSPIGLLDSETVRKNRTLLNNLKSNLMYQYPPMYGYTSSSSGRIVNEPQPALATTNMTLTSRTKQPEIRMETIPNSSNASKTALESLPPPVQHRPGSLESSGARSYPSYLSSRRPSTQLASTDIENKFTSENTTTMSGLASATATAQLPYNLRHMVTFDDHAANDSDRYDHMLVNPTITNSIQRTRFPNQPNYGQHHHHNQPNEITSTSQLLYLTECVSSCPSDHIELIFYRCIPNNWRFSLFPNAINVTRTFIDDILTDVSHCYRELIYTFSLALVLSLGLLILLRFLASIIIWSCIMLLITLFLSMASYSWLTYYYQILDLNQMMPHDSSYSDRLAASDKWLIASIFLTFLAFATIGTIIFMRKRILLVTMLFRESGKAIADMPLLLLQPLLTFAVLLAITVGWSLGLICLQSMKVPVIDVNTGFVVFRAETFYKIMKWYHVFAFLWVSHFAIACQHYVIGASVSKWYFSPNRYNLNSPIGTSISELILYYLGSVALGSFLVAIFKVIRIVTRQIQYLVQRNCMSAPNSNQSMHNSGGLNSTPISSSCCGSFAHVWRIFIWFFDNIVMIINRDAYVEIAIHGHSFLSGARRAFTVLASNPLKLLAIKSVSNILLVIAKICVVFGTVSMAHLLVEDKSHQLNYSWSPIVISAIYAYIVAHWFLSVYEMVIDALFICYCEEYELSKSREANGQIQMTGSNFINQILNNNSQLY